MYRNGCRGTRFFNCCRKWETNALRKKSIQYYLMGLKFCIKIRLFITRDIAYIIALEKEQPSYFIRSGQNV